MYRKTIRDPMIALALALAATWSGAEPKWPKAWFEAAKTASEIGLTTLSQSPMLDDRNLPPVSERLPDDPVVIVPYREIGRYGGKARITLGDSWQFFNWEAALTQPPVAGPGKLSGHLPADTRWQDRPD